MNNIFRVIWNQLLNRWVVTSELGKSGKKASRSEKRTALLTATIIGALTMQGAVAEVKDYADEKEILEGSYVLFEADKISSNRVNIGGEGNFAILGGTLSKELRVQHSLKDKDPTTTLYLKDVTIGNGGKIESNSSTGSGTLTTILDGVKFSENASLERNIDGNSDEKRDEVIKLLGVTAGNLEIEGRDSSEAKDHTSITLGESTKIKSIDFGTKSGGFEKLEIEFQNGIANKFIDGVNLAQVAKASADKPIKELNLYLSGIESIERDEKSGTLSSKYSVNEYTLNDDDVVVLKGESSSVLGQLKKADTNGQIIIGKNATINDGVLLTKELSNDHKYNLTVEGDEGNGAGTYVYTADDATFAHNLSVKKSGQNKTGGTFKVNLKKPDSEFTFADGSSISFGDKTNFVVDSGRVTTDVVNRADKANFTVGKEGTLALNHKKPNNKSIDNLTLAGGTVEIKGSTNDSPKLQLNKESGAAFTLKGENKVTWDGINGNSLYDPNKSIFDQQEIVSKELLGTANNRTDWAVVEDNATLQVNGVDAVIDLKNDDASAQKVLSESDPNQLNKTEYKGGDDALVHSGFAASLNNRNLGVASGIVALEALKENVLLEASAGENALDIKLTGDGGFDFSANGAKDETIILKNEQNDFTGKSTISSGTVQLGADNALGKSKEMSVADKAVLDFDGKTQTIENDSALTVEVGGSLTGNGTLNLASSTATLNFNSENAETLNPKVTGEGKIKVNLNTKENEFTFGDNQNDDFKGTLDLANATYDIAKNGDKLESATLKVSDNSIAKHDSANGGKVGALDLNGGSLHFNGTSAHPSDNNGIAALETGDLTITDSNSTIVLGDGLIFSNNQIDDYKEANQHKNLLDQQETTNVQLVTASGDVKGGQVKIANSSGTLAENGDKTEVIQELVTGGEKQGTATYDFHGQVNKDGAQKGISLAYGLTKLSVDDGKVIEINREGATNGDLSAQLTGDGGFDFVAKGGGDDGKITISGNDNDYKGDTTISGGTVELAGNNSLGKGGDVTLKGDDAQLKLHIDEERSIDTVGDKNIIIADAGKIEITSSGKDLNHLNAQINGPKGTIDIIPDGANAGTLQLDKDFIADTTNLKGKGSGLALNGNKFESNLNIDQGANLLSRGDNTVKGNISNKGDIYIGSRAEDLLNGKIDTPTSENFATLTIDGDYRGEKGSNIHFGGNFAGDDSKRDKLVITGELEGEGSNLIVKNVKGAGAPTNDGILLVEAKKGEGKADYFTLNGDGPNEGLTVGGAYLYELKDPSKDGEWRLHAVKIDSSGGDGSNGGGNSGGSGSNSGGNSGGAGGGQLAIAPHTGAYLANQAASNTLFTHSLHDRNYFENTPHVWGRVDAHVGNFKDSAKQSKTKTERYVMQIGGDILQLGQPDDPVYLGLMGGIGHHSSTTKNAYLDGRRHRAKGEGNGFAVGTYVTYGEPEDFYLDGSLQYVRMNNKVKADYLHGDDSYKSKGWVASAEVGAPSMLVSDTVKVQPQGQVTWQGVKQDRVNGHDGAEIYANRGNVEFRLGARATGVELNENGINPYAELNLYHNTKAQSATFDDYRIHKVGSRNLGEVKVGVNGQIIDRSTSVWGEVSHKQGGHSYRDTKLSVGLKHVLD